MHSLPDRLNQTCLSTNGDLQGIWNMRIITLLFSLLMLCCNQLSCTSQSLDQWLDIIDKAEGNRSPVIEAVILERAELDYDDTIEITILANDPDGDLLEYAYSALDTSNTNEMGIPYQVGSIEGTGANIQYHAPSNYPADVTLTILVKDMKSDGSYKGGYAQTTRQLSIRNDAPVINTLLVVGSESYLGQEIPIYFIATDPDGDPITYTWSSNIEGVFEDLSDQDQHTGTVSPSGNTVYFADFNTWGKVSFKLELSDGKGNYTFGYLDANILPPLGESEYESYVNTFSYSPSIMMFPNASRGWFTGLWGTLFQYTRDETTQEPVWNYVASPYNGYYPFLDISESTDGYTYFMNSESLYFYDGTSVDEFDIPTSMIGKLLDIEMWNASLGWAATYGIGVYEYQNDTWTRLSIQSEFIDNRIIENMPYIGLNMINESLGYVLGVYYEDPNYVTTVFRFDGEKWIDQRYTTENQDDFHALVNAFYLITDSVGILYSELRYGYEDEPVFCYTWEADSWPPKTHPSFVTGNLYGMFEFFGMAGVFGGYEKDGGSKITKVLRYVHGSDSWQDVSEGLPSDDLIRDVSLVNSNSLYVCTESGNFYAYNGETWESMSLSIAREEVTKIIPHRMSMLSPDEGWCVVSGIPSHGRDPIYLMLYYDGTTWQEYNYEE